MVVENRWLLPLATYPPEKRLRFCLTGLDINSTWDETTLRGVKMWELDLLIKRPLEAALKALARRMSFCMVTAKLYLEIPSHAPIKVYTDAAVGILRPDRRLRGY